MSILTMCQWLEDTGPATWVREAYRGYPITQTVHMLGMALFGGAVVMDDLRLLGKLRLHRVSELSRQLLPLKWCGFVITTVSGVLLFMSDATMLYSNPAFLAKVILLLLIAVNAWVFRSVVYRDVAGWDQSPVPPAGAKRAAILSLILWTAVIFTSRAIAFAKGEA